MSERCRIAILGAGPAALAAAFQITEAPDWRDRFEIDIYHLGWRPGGKCASGRNPEARWRNEEHGLHILGGFYHNVFRHLRRIYAEWPTVAPGAALPFDVAFEPVDRFTLLQRDPGGWRPVRVNMPRRAGAPGLDVEQTPLPDRGAVLLDLLGTALRRISAGQTLADIFPDDIEPRPSPLAPRYEADAAWLEAEAAALRGAAGLIPPDEAGRIERLDAIRARLDADPVLEGAEWIGVLLYGVTVARGWFADRIAERGFDAIDGEEAEAWLRRHGAPERALRCALFRAGYHYAFGFVDGDPQRPDIAAGAGLRALFRMMFGYRGSVFVHMLGGMGEIYVMPFYDVLRARGVRFHPFHRVDALRPGADGRIAAVELSIQARLKPGLPAYDAAIPRPNPAGGGRRVFLTRPDYGQLAPGTVRSDHYESMTDTPVVDRRTLRADGDFDLCVLALPPGALHRTTSALAAASPAWQAMLDGAASAPTLAAQIWDRRPVRGSGWSGQGLFTAFEFPLDTWSDMSFLLADEDGPTTSGRPAGLSYFCGPVMRGSGDQDDEQVRAGKLLDRWLALHAGRAFPHLSKQGAYDPTGEIERYARINSDPSALYSLHRAGTVRTRMRPHESGFANLYLAGDWTRHNFDLGALEPAAMSGIMCARAITGDPVPIDGESDFA